jgi:hypothetical protein
MEHFHEEEAYYHFTMMDFVSLVESYGDRVRADIEKFSPDVYEAFCAYKANQEIYEFVSNKSKDADCDYYKED